MKDSRARAADTSGAVQVTPIPVTVTSADGPFTSPDPGPVSGSALVGAHASCSPASAAEAA
jgi:hypothetical protein